MSATEMEIQNALVNLMDNLADAHEEMEGNDDDLAMADLARDMVASFDWDGEECIASVRSYEDVGMLTSDSGLVIRMADGSEYQLTIVQSKRAH